MLASHGVMKLYGYQKNSKMFKMKGEFKDDKLRSHGSEDEHVVVAGVIPLQDGLYHHFHITL